MVKGTVSQIRGLGSTVPTGSAEDAVTTACLKGVGMTGSEVARAPTASTAGLNWIRASSTPPTQCFGARKGSGEPGSTSAPTSALCRTFRVRRRHPGLLMRSPDDQVVGGRKASEPA